MDPHVHESAETLCPRVHTHLLSNALLAAVHVALPDLTSGEIGAWELEPIPNPRSQRLRFSNQPVETESWLEQLEFLEVLEHLGVASTVAGSPQLLLNQSLGRRCVSQQTVDSG